MNNILNIVIPMAGRGSRFKDAGYAFPKPLIDVQGKTMIEVVVNNLRPSVDHRFIFVVQKEHYDLFDLYNVLKTISKNKFEVVVINGITEGAACTVLTALEFINNDDDLLIANSDQFIETSIDGFVQEARLGNKDGFIMTVPVASSRTRSMRSTLPHRTRTRSLARSRPGTAKRPSRAARMFGTSPSTPIPLALAAAHRRMVKPISRSCGSKGFTSTR